MSYYISNYFIFRFYSKMNLRCIVSLILLATFPTLSSTMTLVSFLYKFQHRYSILILCFRNDTTVDPCASPLSPAPTATNSSHSSSVIVRRASRAQWTTVFSLRELHIRLVEKCRILITTHLRHL